MMLHARIGCLLAIVVATSTARGAEPATADALFREGRAAMQRNDWPRAVQVLAESQRLEPAAGTLLNLAMAEHKLGSLAAAWEHARSAMDQLGATDDRRKLAIDLFESLDKQLPRLRLRSSAVLPAAARVRVDGVELRHAALGVDLPLDPGPHKLELSAPHHKISVVSFTLREGERVEKLLQLGEPLPSPDPLAPPATADSSHASNWRTTGWVSLGLGATCLAVGGATGYLALNRNNTVEQHCDGHYCDPIGTQAASEGKTFASTSSVTVISGVALALAGTLLIVLNADRPGSPSTRGRPPTGFVF
jgi:hypothetical protein